MKEQQMKLQDIQETSGSQLPRGSSKLFNGLIEKDHTVPKHIVFK